MNDSCKIVPYPESHSHQTKTRPDAIIIFSPAQEIIINYICVAASIKFQNINQLSVPPPPPPPSRVPHNINLRAVVAHVPLNASASPLRFRGVERAAPPRRERCFIINIAKRPRSSLRHWYARAERCTAVGRECLLCVITLRIRGCAGRREPGAPRLRSERSSRGIHPASVREHRPSETRRW